MTEGTERGSKGLPFLEVLGNVMQKPDYLVGAEPEGSGWDFSNWTGYDYTKFHGWVLGEKFFELVTSDNRLLAVRVIHIDCKQFIVKDVEVSFVLTPISSKHFPTIMIGKDRCGNETILRSSSDPLEIHQIPEYFKDLAEQVGTLESHKVITDRKGSLWGHFLKDVLSAKKVFPSLYRTPESLIREEMEIGPSESYSSEDELLVLMQMAEQELLMIGFADFLITPLT